jgi:hypothetical protein
MTAKDAKKLADDAIMDIDHHYELIEEQIIDAAFKGLYSVNISYPVISKALKNKLLENGFQVRKAIADGYNIDVVSWS